MNVIKNVIGEMLIKCSTLIYDLTSGWLSGEEDAPACFLKHENQTVNNGIRE